MKLGLHFKRLKMLVQTCFKYCFYCFFTDTESLLDDLNVITDGIFDTIPLPLIDSDINWDEVLGNIERSDSIGLLFMYFFNQK